jgi:hypothetical protein
MCSTHLFLHFIPIVEVLREPKHLKLISDHFPIPRLKPLRLDQRERAVKLVNAEIDFVPAEELACFGVPDLDRELAVPGFDVARFEPPIKLHRLLSLELGVVGIAVVDGPEGVIFARRGPSEPFTFPHKQTASFASESTK